ncbi:MAG TPA: peptide chain release factor N(5)-glutamine methyltransferase [Gemmatimonadaceae bacterium]|nr:peptide chain release factor N(5)-glutamine methyltransferase [Gemmatimonadaceae bacterium]
MTTARTLPDAGSVVSDAGGNAATIGRLLDALALRFGGANGMPARAEARDLIAAVLDVPRFWPSAHRDVEITVEDGARIQDAATRFSRGMPLPYAVRRAAFRHLSLYVDERVLIPRPETELLVDIVLEATSGGRGTVIDIGTGSGAIALALAAEGGFDRVIGTDVSADALAVAQLNADYVQARGVRTPKGASSHTARNRPAIEWCQGSYFAPVRGVRADVVVSNPPYISPREANELPALVRDWEPAVALFAENDGMAAIAGVVDGAGSALSSGGVLVIEIDSRRSEHATALMRDAGCYRDVVVRTDLTGRPRFACARRV